MRGGKSGTNGKKPRREEIPPDKSLCAFCSAKCCRYFALPIDTPTEWADFDSIRWFLFHDRATVFVEKGDWYLLVYTPCKHLREDNLCSIYDERPQICRDYSTVDCEYEDDWVYDQYFETSEQVEEYAEAVLGPRDGHVVRSPRSAKSRRVVSVLSLDHVDAGPAKIRRGHRACPLARAAAAVSPRLQTGSNSRADRSNSPQRSRQNGRARSAKKPTQTPPSPSP